MNTNPTSLQYSLAVLFVVLIATRLMTFVFKGYSARRQDERLRVLEQKVDAITRHLNLSNSTTPMTPPLPSPFDNAPRKSAPNTIPFSGATNLNLSASDQAELAQMVRAGRKIEAIKYLRERSNLGLRDAKDAVEAVEKLW